MRKQEKSRKTNLENDRKTSEQSKTNYGKT